MEKIFDEDEPTYKASKPETSSADTSQPHSNISCIHDLGAKRAIAVPDSHPYGLANLSRIEARDRQHQPDSRMVPGKRRGLSSPDQSGDPRRCTAVFQGLRIGS